MNKTSPSVEPTINIRPFKEMLLYINSCLDNKSTFLQEMSFRVDGIIYKVYIQNTKPDIEENTRGTDTIDIETNSTDILSVFQGAIKKVSQSGSVLLKLGSTDRHKKYIIILVQQDISLVRDSIKYLTENAL